MKIYNIFTDEECSFIEGKADLLLASSSDKTSHDKDLLVTPIINAEFITNEKVFSLPSSEVTAPAIITRAIENLNPFSSIAVVDLGLQNSPQNTKCYNLNIASLDSAKEIFEKGMIFGKSYELKGNYLILSENSINSQRDLISSVLSLDFESENNKISNFQKLSIASNSMVFCAGFLLEASRRFHVVLGGGIEMALVLFIADKLREDVLMRVKHDNITFITTQWDAKHIESVLLDTLQQLSYTPHAVYTDFDFSLSEILQIKEYQETSRGMNIGFALAYAITNKLDCKAILNEIEIVSYS